MSHRPIYFSFFMSRRKYWIPGVDAPNQYPSAYDVAAASMARLKSEFGRIES